MKNNIDLGEIREAYERLPQQFASLLMATVDHAGWPHASYAAYVKENGDYYIYISELAAHTRNIAENGRVSLLFIENEDQARHLFARQRVTYQCDAAEVARDSERFRQVMALFSEKFGMFMESLRQLQDFHLYRLHPLKGSYVQGFARAFAVDGEQMERIRPLNEIGHQADKPVPGQRAG